MALDYYHSALMQTYFVMQHFLFWKMTKSPVGRLPSSIFQPSLSASVDGELPAGVTAPLVASLARLAGRCEPDSPESPVVVVERRRDDR